MIYPKSEEYRAAFQYIGDTLIDEILKNGIVKRNALGPQVLSGNFAYAYEVTSQYRVKYAVRCFRYDSKDRKERYKAISDYLKKLKSSYFVNFEYQDEGIIVNNVKYPIVKMAWAEGELLGDFIKNNYANRFKIKNLLNSVRKLAKFIEKNNFAHGDIQPGNIIVSDEGRTLKLIDYDGMYVEELKNFGNCECGVPNFQHPKRDGFWSKRLDRFSFIVLYVALLALMNRHYLWDETDSDVETILFRAEDYIDTKNSKIFKKLYALKSMEKYARGFEYVCNGRFKNIPSLDDFIKDYATRRHTSIIVPVATVTIIFFIALHIYYNQVSKIGKQDSLWQTVTTIFHQNVDSINMDLWPQNLYLYDIREYEIAIERLKIAYDLHPNDTNTALSLIMVYGMSGFDDNALLNLALPLKNAKIRDERLFFSLAALYWRKGDLKQAKIFIDELNEKPTKDIGLQKLITLLEDIVQKEIELYDSYYSAMNLKANDKAEFATLMVLWDRPKLYKNMEEMYKQSFIGFLAEHKFNTFLPFKDWFEVYSGYNAAKSLQKLNDLYKQYPANNYLIYQLAVNIAYLHVGGRDGSCASDSNMYLYAAAILSDKVDIIDVSKALNYANKLLDSGFSKAYGYYALGLAYYANNEFENAQKALTDAKSYTQKKLSGSIDSLLNKITDSLMCRAMISDFQKL
ncbi:MAG: hypothetical protein LBH45_05375 [Campylobacteraceae bacterium]|jgi:tRNA A-37 threonylcarbamoyl transferase component Bud32|nr:hypothetical protein [Campylobacteraceae bacterium]